MLTMAKEATRTMRELKRIPLPKREEVSSRWQGIQHGELAEQVMAQLDSRGVRVERDQWGVYQNDQAMVGSLDLDIPADFKLPVLKDMRYSLGIQHSNNGRHALKFVVGAVVLVCTNGMVARQGEFVVNRKHTSGLSLVDFVSGGLDVYFERLGEVVDNQRKMLEHDVTLPEADHFLVEAGRRGLMSWSHLGQVVEEFQRPTFSEFNERTRWSLYNAFTYVTRKEPYGRQMQMMGGFNELLQQGVN